MKHFAFSIFDGDIWFKDWKPEIDLYLLHLAIGRWHGSLIQISYDFNGTYVSQFDFLWLSVLIHNIKNELKSKPKQFEQAWKEWEQDGR
jgi:hypothetical protein